ncbi:nicotinamide mononucleotide transporter family protein [Schleiferiaceae bacterium]|nr:nicotinamide mononucleotide transporter family protein [Schleiferiaceae bacterium]
MRWVEGFSALLNLLYVLGLIRHKRWAWPAGFLGCLLAVILFYDQKLFLESTLNLAYAGLAVFGWIQWGIPTRQVSITSLSFFTAIQIGGIGLIISGILSYVFARFSSNPNPILDSGIFTFSILATYGQAKRILQNWHAWILINLAMVLLCLWRDLTIYAAYSALMTVLAFAGLRSWKLEDRP